jgi:hypothetical protein
VPPSGILGHQSKPGGCFAPDAFEVTLDSLDSFRAKGVDTSGALAGLRDQASLAQESQVTRYRRPADRERIREFMHGTLATAQDAQNLSAVRVSKRVERIARRFR